MIDLNARRIFQPTNTDTPMKYIALLSIAILLSFARDSRSLNLERGRFHFGD